MPTNPGIIGGVQFMGVETPAEGEARYQTGVAARQAQAITMADLQRKAAVQKIVAEAKSPEDLISKLMIYDPKMAMELQEKQLSIAKARTDLGNAGKEGEGKDIANSLARIKQASGVLEQLLETPGNREDRNSALATAKEQLKPLFPGRNLDVEIGTDMDVATQQRIRLLIGQSQLAAEQAEAALKAAADKRAAEEHTAKMPGLEADTASKQFEQIAKTAETEGQLLGAAQSQGDWDAALAMLPPASQSRYSKTFSKGNAQLASRMGMTPLQRSQAAADQTRANNSGSGGSGSGGLTSDAVDKLAASFNVIGNAAIPTRFDEGAKTTIINRAAAMSKERGLNPAQQAMRQAAYKADQSALTKMRGMASSASAFEEKALKQIDIVRDRSKKVKRGDWPLINKYVMEGKIQTGDTNATLLANAILTFSGEFAKIHEGSTGSSSGSSDAARRAATELINEAMSAGTLDKVLDQMKQEMGFTMDGYDAVIDNISTRMSGEPSTRTQENDGEVIVIDPTGKPFGVIKASSADQFLKDHPTYKIQK